MEAPKRKPAPPHETEWWRQGFMAALDGLDESACPHPTSTDAAAWWRQGWNDELNAA